MLHQSTQILGTVEQEQFLESSKAVLRRIRNYLAGQVVGITRDEAMLEELIKSAFCRVTLERRGQVSSFHKQDSPENIAKQYRQTFHAIKQKFSALFDPQDELLLGPGDIAFVDRELAKLQILSNVHDLIGDIYETFIGSGYRGQEGQFFTPGAAVRTLVALTEPVSNDVFIDPACGSGSFLLEAARFIAGSSNVCVERMHGVDKDSYLVRLAQLHLAIQYDALFPITCADSLAWDNHGFETSPTKQLKGQFTLILTNPPFGTRIVALSGETRYAFDLAYKWRYDKDQGRYLKQSKIAVKTPPQVLFVERCISLLAPGGRVGMVLPESVLSSPSYRHVVQYILDHTTPLAVIGMPESLFKTSGRGGTHTKVCLIVLKKSIESPSYSIFMAEAKWCGHDSRAREIPHDDLPSIVEKFRAFQAGEKVQSDRLGFLVSSDQLRNLILAPRFYNPAPMQMMTSLKKTHRFFKVADLVRDGFLSFSTGDEIGKLAYGTGDIPFVRTSDLSNWEIKIDPKHMVSEDIYSQYAARQDVREGDILMVRDGTYLIGTCAFISRFDTRIVYQSHIYKIRVHEGAPFDSYLLLAILSSTPVLAQVKSLSFTQDIIDSLGDRVSELVLPAPFSEARCKEISSMVKRAIESRIEARNFVRKARHAVVEP
jgi:type I restriction enzyme M protein